MYKILVLLSFLYIFVIIKNTTMIFAYVRVSTRNQNVASQLEDIKKHGYDEIFEDVISGKKFERPGFDTLKSKLRKDDILLLWRLDRLGRSMHEVLKIIAELNKMGVAIISIKDGIDTRTSTGRLLAGIMSTLAEYERELLIERQMAGINEARRRGVRIGRPKGIPKKNHTKIKTAKALYKDPNYTVTEILEELNISRGTFYKYIKIK